MRAPELDDPAATADALHGRFAALRAEGRNDGAYCVAHAAAVLLGRAAPAALVAFANGYRPPRPRRAERPVDPASWLTRLYHVDDDPYVGKVFEAVLAPVRRVRTRLAAQFGLAAAEAANHTTSVAVVRALGGAAHALDVPMPLVFLRAQDPRGITHVPSEPIASTAGAAVLGGCSIEELTFEAGRHMAYYRPDHYVRTLYAGASELTILFLAALRVVRDDLEVPPGVETIAADLRRLVAADAAASALLPRVAALFLDRGQPVDLARWLDGVELTAARAGLLLAGDLDVARAATSRGGAPAHALDDLARFAVSDDYIALRQSTGIALWPDAALQPSPAEVAPPAPSPAAPTVMPPPMLAEPFGAADAADALRSMDVPLADLEAPSEEFADEATMVETPSRAALEVMRGARGGVGVAPVAPRPSLLAPPRVPDAVPAADATECPVEGAPAAAPERAAADAVVARAADAQAEASHAELAEEFAAHRAAGALDRAYHVAAVWVWRAGAGADAGAHALVATRRADAPAEVGTLTDADWHGALCDPGEGTPVGRLLAALAAPMRLARRRTPEDFAFEATAAAGDELPFAALARRAALALAAPAPLVFVVGDSPFAIVRPGCEPPSALVAPARLASWSPAELAFVAAEHVAYLRPERQARVLGAVTGALADVVRTVARAFGTGKVVRTDDLFVDGVVTALAADPTALAAAREWVGALPAGGDLDDEVYAWCEAAERTAARAALVVAFDLEAAAAALARDRGAPSLLAPEAKLSMLEDFARTEAFAALRRRLGY